MRNLRARLESHRKERKSAVREVHVRLRSGDFALHPHVAWSVSQKVRKHSTGQIAKHSKSERERP